MIQAIILFALAFAVVGVSIAEAESTWRRIKSMETEELDESQ